MSFARFSSSAAISLALVLVCTFAKASEGEEEIIDDPLSNKPKELPKPPVVVVAPQTSPDSPAFHLDVWARAGMDTKWTRDELAPTLGEDVVRARLRTTLGVSGGSFTGLRYALEVRLDLQARAKKGESGLDRAVYLYEAIPTSAYFEAPLGERLRFRIGEQVVAWGRMDLASAADVLERRDLREGPTTDPTGLRLPTPTVRVDAHLSSQLDATLAWTVVAMPHRYDVLGTSWAFFGPGVLGRAGPSRAYLDMLARSLDATTFIRLQDAIVTATTPEARLDGGEIGARLNAHVGGVDLGLTYGWVRSKVPILEPSQVLRDLPLLSPFVVGIELMKALANGTPLVTTSYPRYHQLALDLEGTAGPFTISWELGYTPSRPLFVDDPSGFPRREDAGLVQAGLRAQWTRGEEIAASLEIEGIEATKAGDWIVLGRKRTILAMLATLRGVVARKHVLEGAVVATSSGPSVALVPRYGYEATDAWTFGLSGAFFPKLRDSSPSDPLTLADVQVGRDMVEVYARFRK